MKTSLSFVKKILVYKLLFETHRYNKLALDGDTTVEEVNLFIPVRSDPPSNTPIQAVAMGTSHAVAITG